MITKELFNSIFPTNGLTSAKNLKKYNLVRQRTELIDALNRILPKYGINNYFRISAFFSNCGIETDYMKTTSEYADGWDYDISVNPAKARELGNYKKGDGPRYKGSGLSQTTGGYNFGEVQKRIGKKLGVDVVKNPELLRKNIDLAVESACIYWDDHNLNQLADRGEFRALSGIVNRGDADLKPLHWEKRNMLYSLCKRRIPKDFAFAPRLLPIVSNVIGSSSYSDIGDSSYTTQTGDTSLPSGYAQTVVLTPTEQGFDLPDLNLDTAKQHLTDGVEMAKRPGVKAVLKVILTKIIFYLTTVWELGLSGKVALILGAILIVSSIGYVLYHYRNQIKVGYQKIKAAVLKAFKKPASV